mmetsp:Transcript_1300/g.1526  ORF Transcript_1300/g.1526 Transcript_1300/m.1526 type:complete len:185 (+) Transcript_1300:124-678(+)|eukprot:CAMPEP_0204637960 /NCGR_PEP_ID=MMETSP0717-20131115/37909_1 /ASSEMBLY_ACC=CAM_ASM_000666 /TAXON_ID=230516 /ORGANISM="Chaetoceros curvisetus" /LENGTH=184 /DNA_ID=CAMNT_0051657527 /DNA_START=120 /DNA_END=674 /DNA_ORIENTATION=-
MIQWENDKEIPFRELYAPERTASTISTLSLTRSEVFDDKFQSGNLDTKEKREALHHQDTYRRKLPPRKDFHSKSMVDWDQGVDDLVQMGYEGLTPEALLTMLDRNKWNKSDFENHRRLKMMNNWLKHIESDTSNKDRQPHQHIISPPTTANTSERCERILRMRISQTRRRIFAMDRNQRNLLIE